MNYIFKFFAHIGNRLGILLRWIFFSTISGAVIGVIGAAFYILMQKAIDFRTEYYFIILFLPFAGLAIIALYHLMHEGGNQGTNLVLASIHSNKEIPVKLTPLIFISTIVTHLFGGSAGREGAALQLGGSIGNFLGRFFKFDDNDRRVVIMCGMSAAFSAVFGTPIAAALFSMEVVSVGIMHYSALVPCAIASLVSSAVAVRLGTVPERYEVLDIVDFSFITGAETIVLAILCAGISVLFCILLHQTEKQLKLRIPNPYIRVFAGGLFIVLLTYVLGTGDYNSTGSQVIEHAINGKAKPEAFILKMIFTAVTLGCGFKGGEIVPSFFIGSTFGCLFGTLLGFSPSLCASIGMVSVFCGVTNCPITSLVIGIELFGTEGIPYYLLAIAVSYMLSGYYGLYHSQKIVYSKYKSKYINITTHK